MLIPPKVLSCCAFVGFRKADMTEVWCGTAFFISRAGVSAGIKFQYVVTAAHVIRNIARTGIDHVLLRCNSSTGGADYAETSISDWIMNESRESCDVAILIGAPSEGAIITTLAEDLIVPDTELSSNEVHVGTEVFWIGLFTRHIGKTRNEPLIRFGNIAAMPMDGVNTKLGLMNAYLIDGVSIGGFSGSPVFSNHGTIKTTNGSIVTANSPIIRLIDMIHGHFNVHNFSGEGIGVPEHPTLETHSGISVVIRSNEILEMLRHPRVLESE